ncbi:MAG TPA: ATP-binding protein [bacterium]|nr:ATP-binding protein [bacterium]
MRKGKELLSLKAWGLLWLPILAITMAHFTTDAEMVWVHDILRRLYYIPIVLGAFGWGLHGALAASIASSLVYLPHAFQMFFHHFHHDPGGSTEKILEILLFNIIALIAGVLVERERRERRRQEEIARKLSETLDEMKLLEEQLIRAGRLQALGELTAGLAHEIKNPLASIKGAAEIVADGIPADSPRRRMVDIQRAEIDRLTALLERFLAFARPKDFVVSQVDIATLMSDTVAFIAPQAAKKKVRFDTRFEPLTVPADREKLTQLLLNILLNAVDASPEGAAVTVTTERRRKGKADYACITIADRGAGIAAELRDKVFNPFYTTKPDGTGLGLSIAARIADQHKGFIEVGSAPEGGALFTVYLPV